jgi:hypothetical protein
MPITNEQLVTLVGRPSLGGIVYQASNLIDKLKEIHDKEYPDQACRVRDLIWSIANYIQDQLKRIQSDGARSEPAILTDSRARKLARVLHRLHSYLRYLRASSPQESPPGIRIGLEELTKMHFPPSGQSAAVHLVRPQWKYNLTCVLLSRDLLKVLDLAALDPNQDFGVEERDKRNILPLLWERWVKIAKPERKDAFNEVFPDHLAILSFAGLDTNEALLYPLLAH